MADTTRLKSVFSTYQAQARRRCGAEVEVFVLSRIPVKPLTHTRTPAMNRVDLTPSQADNKKVTNANGCEEESSVIPEGNVIGNLQRFNGFQEEYERYRPEAPKIVIDLLTTYLNHKPDTVLDLGCGTGLSTFIWIGSAAHIVGVEPNDGMRAQAEAKLQNHPDASSVTFRKGYSNETGMPNESVDIVTCSQSFHWMEPESTLSEVSRILRRGGVFAAYDCDWPPSANWEVEDKYDELMYKVDVITEQFPETSAGAKKWNKSSHLQNMQKSGVFRFAREIVFHHVESCDADRFVGLATTQGGLQTVLKANPDSITDKIDALRAAAEDYFQGSAKDIVFSYRMRLGVK